MIVKNIEINNFQPKVCVPMVDTNIEDAIADATAIVEEGAKIIEWRLDYLEEMNDREAVRAALNKMAEICKDTVLVVTIRTIAQGGNSILREEEMIDYLNFLADTKACDFIDVEYFTYDKPDKLIGQLRDKGARVICSHHDFDATPDDDVVLTLLENMEDSDCDVVKIAVMPETTSDVTRFIDICNTFARNTDKLFVSMSMGKLGVISRVAGVVTGSCISFGARMSVSAPGQINYKVLEKIIDNVQCDDISRG